MLIMDSKLISIIIPTFNRAHLIIETLVSIKQQTYVNWECLIIDDGSTDNTISVITDFCKWDSRFTYLHRPTNRLRGPSSCRNYGFELSKGNFIQFFDSDDIMHPNHLEEKIIAIKSSDFVVCKLKEFAGIFREDSFFNDDVDNIVDVKNIFESFVTGSFPMMMVAPMWKKASLQPYLPIREDMHILEDHDLYARALFDTKSYEIVNKSLIYYRVGITSATNSFYSDLDYGIDSYFKAKKTVLGLFASKRIKLAILKMTLGFFRMGLAQKNYVGTKKCLDFIKNENLCYSIPLKLKFLRIYFFYFFFKTLGRGDTKFKILLKI